MSMTPAQTLPWWQQRQAKGGTETAYYTSGDELLSVERNGKVCYYLYDRHGGVYDPVSLHKYLYAGVDTVKYTDPTGYDRLNETTVTQAGLLMIGTSMLFAGTVALNIYFSLRKNMVSAVVSLECKVSVTDWKNVILGFPAYDFEIKRIVTIIINPKEKFWKGI